MNSTNRQCGFSLVEILLVLFIVAMVTSFASLSVGGNSGTKFRYQAKQFSELTRLAVETSTLNGEVIGLYFYSKNEGRESQFQWCRLSEDEEPLAAEHSGKILLPQVSVNSEALIVRVEGELITRDELGEAETLNRPLALIYPSGEATRFSLALIDRDEEVVLQQVELDTFAGVDWHDGSI